MTFATKTKKVLREVADQFAVEIDANATKAQMLKRLGEDGVTWNMYKAAVERGEMEGDVSEPEEEEAPVAPVVETSDEVEEEQVAPEPLAVVQAPKQTSYLLKMIRPNHSYRIMGYKFTREHPYAVIRNENDANWLLSHVGGFRLANPEEVRAYYS